MIYNIDNYVDGLMLSDGSISSRNHIGFSNARYVQVCKEKEWLDVIKSDFELFGLESTISGTYVKYNNKIYPRLKSKFCDFFYSVHKRWYKEWYDNPDDETKVRYKKIVPEDIKLTPECVANWYFGDGCLSLNKRQNHYVVSLTTTGFTKSEVVFLSELLTDVLDLDFHIDNSKNSIRLFKQNQIIVFLDYIKDFKVGCYKYKFGE